jgi:hypothetical protein
MEKPRGTGPRLLRFRREPVTAQGNTVTDEKVIAVLSLSSSACVGFGRWRPFVVCLSKDSQMRTLADLRSGPRRRQVEAEDLWGPL